MVYWQVCWLLRKWRVGHGGVAVNALDFRSEGWWFEAQSPHSVISLDKILYPTLSLSTQVYKMGTGGILLGVTLWWTSIPSRGEWQYSQLLHAMETGISSWPAMWASLAWVRLLSLLWENEGSCVKHDQGCWWRKIPRKLNPWGGEFLI